jgi:hypothetical protein
MKKGIRFSLQLLRTNLKYHEGEIKRIEANLKKSKSLTSYFKTGLKQHKKFHADLTLAINTLIGTKPKEKNEIVCITSPNVFTRNCRVLTRQKPEYKIIKKIK